VDIKHEPLANVRMAYINKDPGRIICLIWGSSNILRYVTTSTAEEKSSMSSNAIGIIGTNK
jgi:hypothetical protein